MLQTQITLTFLFPLILCMNKKCINVTTSLSIIQRICHSSNWFFSHYNLKVVYILDQVRALENEMLLRIKRQGLDITPRILIVSVFILCSCWISSICSYVFLFSICNSKTFLLVYEGDQVDTWCKRDYLQPTTWKSQWNRTHSYFAGSFQIRERHSS